MQTQQWKRESLGGGKYHVRLNDILIPGIIIGANKHYQIQIGGAFVSDHTTLRAAENALIRRAVGI